MPARKQLDTMNKLNKNEGSWVGHIVNILQKSEILLQHNSKEHKIL